MICSTLVADSMNKKRNAIGSDFNNSFWICLLFSNPLMRLDSLLQDQEHNATGYECCDYYSSAALGKRRPHLDFLLRVIRICCWWYPCYISSWFRGHQFQLRNTSKQEDVEGFQMWFGTLLTWACHCITKKILFRRIIQPELFLFLDLFYILSFLPHMNKILIMTIDMSLITHPPRETRRTPNPPRMFNHNPCQSPTAMNKGSCIR